MKLTRQTILIILVAFIASSSWAQKSKKQDITSIKSMCGCYEVKFNFAETFSPKTDYEFHKNYSAGALEYVFPIEETKNKIVLQHLLVINDEMIIKHWRQDWLYENTALYTFYKDDTWNYKKLESGEVKGQWTQKVFQVDDSPRYEGTASWVHKDGRHYWEAVADAPLPRREFSKRKDYNVMKRRNRQEITANGWLHEQDNDKILRDGADELIAQEKGMNQYIKVTESKCQLANDWWAKNNLYWTDVRAVWDELFAKNETVKINMKVAGTKLYQRLFELGDQLNGDQYDAASSKNQIKSIIEKHLQDNPNLSLK